MNQTTVSTTLKLHFDSRVEEYHGNYLPMNILGIYHVPVGFDTPIRLTEFSGKSVFALPTVTVRSTYIWGYFKKEFSSAKESLFINFEGKLPEEVIPVLIEKANKYLSDKDSSTKVIGYAIETEYSIA